VSQASSYALQKVPARKETAVILTIQEDSMIFLLEILKFLGTVAMIMVTGLLLLMAG
jgi:hypothetical protein